MFFEEHEKDYRLVAPDVDDLISYLDNGLDTVISTPALLAAFEKLYALLEDLAPLPEDRNAKAIWIRIPRGTIEEYGNCNLTFEEAREDGRVTTFEEYEKEWLLTYPDETVWYRLTVVKTFDYRGDLFYYGVRFGLNNVISASIEERSFGHHNNYGEGAAIKLCELIEPAVIRSMDLLRAGTYNDLVQAELPPRFRVGVIRHACVREYDPEDKARDYDGLSEENVTRFRALIESGVNSVSRIGRIHDFTANVFFRACKIGYEAIGWNCEGLSLPEIYLHYSDGRDEGLTGQAPAWKKGPRIDFDDPKAWDKWYNGKRFGGHPWEVVPGGSFTQMNLYVQNDLEDLNCLLGGGEITEAEYHERMKSAGYYFCVSGINRPFETVMFYLTLTDAGLPVIVSNSKGLLARFDATDYIGILPDHLTPRDVEELVPEAYGELTNIMSVNGDKDPWFPDIEWLPEEPAKLASEV